MFTALANESECRGLKKLSRYLDIGMYEICLRSKDNDSINWYNSKKIRRSHTYAIFVGRINLE